MDEIIAQITQRTGLSADQARAAVEVVISHLKSRLPGPLASHLDAIVGTSGTGSSAGATNAAATQPAAGGLGGLAGELGGLFGKK